jgi:predicted ATPase
MANLEESAEQLFGVVLDLPPEQRAAFLDRACDHAPELRSLVEDLLATNDRLGSFLKQPLCELVNESAPLDGLPLLHSCLAAGTNLGHYSIIEPLGFGGMGVVYLARDVILNRNVALKILPVELSTNEDLLHRFEREALAASALNHPNIVTIYERGQEGSTHYIAMELVEGKTLRQLLDIGLLPIRKTIEIAAQIADGLAKAHEAGIAHRDMKPENLMVLPDGRVKILDFGLAKLALGDFEISNPRTRSMMDTHPGLILGTMQYMSPEQASGGSSDTRSDQFSLGLVLYEMVTGERAFQRPTAAETLTAIIRERAAPIGMRNPDAPAPFCWAIERCLAKEPDSRYKVTRDLARELATIRDHMMERPQKPLEIRSTNLPTQRTGFVGRKNEALYVKGLLLREDMRLVTITGSGGIGKTRLALQVASTVAGHFPGGIHFIALHTLSDPALVPSAILQALGIKEAGEQSALEKLKEILWDLSSRSMLLVLDNFEHLVAGASVVTELLATAASLKILVTSRAALHLYGEQEFPVPPLALPNSRALPPVDALSQYSAIALFVQRAVASKPAFELTGENAPAVVEICTRLDGLPLAIELAAARIKVLSPASMTKRLASRLTLLTGGSRDLPQRQQTLRAAIDWSHDLLSQAEQKLFRRLSVFVGGCNLESAEAVCDASCDLDLDLLDGMASMVDKSLLQQIQNATGESRFAMLETIREYALERLEASGEKALTKRAHAAYCLVLAEEDVPEEKDTAGADWLHRLAVEHDNFRAGLEWLIEVEDAEWALRLGCALFRFWETSEYLFEGRDTLTRILKLPGAAGATTRRARACFAAGALANEQGDYVAGNTLIRESLEISRRLDDKQAVAVYLNALALNARSLGDLPLAQSLLEECLTNWRQTENQEAVARSLSNLGNIVQMQGDYSRATTIYDECRSIFERLGNSIGAAWSMNSQGDVYRDQGLCAAAAAMYGQCLQMFRELEDPWGIAGTLGDLGSLATREENYDTAYSFYRESLLIFQQLDHKRGIARLLECFACLAAAQHQSEHSLRLAGTAAALRKSIGAPLIPAEESKLKAAIEPTREALTENAGAAAWLEGWAMPVETAIERLLEPKFKSQE